jgi:cbb3-type cytochrome oxidase subunit 1
MIFLYAKVAGYGQSIFVDKYFWTLNLMLNGFTWFLVFCWLLFIVVSRTKWPLGSAEVHKLTDG